MRIFAISDLHIDFHENYQWLQTISEYDFRQDTLILAGDITDNRLRLLETFKLLIHRFRYVFYVPGNHDLWALRYEMKNSLEIFFEIQEIARDCGVLTAPKTCGVTTIIPLFGWYDYSFGQPSLALYHTWVDFKACQWPENYKNRDITRYFLELNDADATVETERVITFSHFLPRMDLIPSFVPDKVKALLPVLGTTGLEKQLRRLNSQIHIYGHSHLNRNVDIDGVRYINNAFGYPYETRIASKRLLCVANA